MADIGSRLREARESQGLSLDQVEEQIRIRRTFLEALEEERFEDLPGHVYARGFIRNYARHLGLDTQDLLRDYAQATGAAPRRVPRVLNEPLLPSSGGRVWSAIFLVVMVLLILALAGWYVYNRFYLGIDPLPTRRTPVVTAVHTATSRVQIVSPSVVTAAVKTNEPSATLDVATLVATTKAPIAVTLVPTETDTPAPSPVPTRTIRPAPSPTASPTAIAGVRVESKLLGATYLEITADGERVYTGILNPGQDQIWTAKRAIALRIGNAAGIQLTVNGVVVVPLGAEGQIVDVEYTLDSLP